MDTSPIDQDHRETLQEIAVTLKNFVVPALEQDKPSLNTCNESFKALIKAAEEIGRIMAEQVSKNQLRN